MSDRIPSQLKAKKHWVVRHNKAPINMITGVMNGWDNPNTWTSYDEALRIYREEPDKYSGIGCISYDDESDPDDRVVWVDLDNCRDPVNDWTSEWAQHILDKLKSPYGPSISGCGFRVVCLGKLPENIVEGKGPQDDIPPEVMEHIFAEKPKVKESYDAGKAVFNGIELHQGIGKDGKPGVKHLTITDTWPEFNIGNGKLENRTIELAEICQPFLKGEEHKSKTSSNSGKKKTSDSGKRTSSLPTLPITTVINTTGFDKSGNELVGPHPIFGSTNGHNLTVNVAENSWYCHHAGDEWGQIGGDAWLWIACECGTIAWKDCKAGALIDPKVINKCKEYALSKGYLTEDVLFPERKVIKNAVERSMKLMADSDFDPLVVFDSENANLLALLKSDAPGEYERIFRYLKGKKLRVTALDKLVNSIIKAKNHGNPSDEEKIEPANWVIEYFMEYELWHTKDKVGYITVNGEHLPIKSSDFDDILTTTFNSETGDSISRSYRETATETLKGWAMRGEVHDIEVRVARRDDKIYLDMANDAREVIEITKEGWRIIKDPPVRFRRPSSMQPLPYPVKGGSLEDFRAVMNLSDDQWVLVQGFIVDMISPYGAYPVLCFIGEGGRLKTKMTERIKKIIDPHSANIFSYPKNDVDTRIIIYENNLVVPFDNIRWLEPDESDEFCKVSTGAGWPQRKFYTQRELIIAHVLKPLILNGIRYFVTQTDLMDRDILIEPPLLTTKITEKEATQTFSDIHPRALGGLLDVAVIGLKNYDSTISSDTRMVDFARWVMACFGPEKGKKFLELYKENKRSTLRHASEGNLLIDTLVAFMKDKREWNGTATELLKVLESETKYCIKPKGWPASAISLSNKINELGLQIKECGIQIDRIPHGRLLKMTHREA